MLRGDVVPNDKVVHLDVSDQAAHVLRPELALEATVDFARHVLRAKVLISRPANRESGRAPGIRWCWDRRP